MKRSWRNILLAAVLMTPLALWAQKQDVKQAAERDTLTYTVYGMDCPGCEGGLEKQINKIPAVLSSEASWVDQRLWVVVKPDSVLKREDVAFRIKKANFTLAETPDEKKE